MDNISKHIHKSNTLRGESTRLMRELLEEYREKVSEIHGDRKLSGEGRHIEVSELKSAYERKVLELARELQKQDRESLTIAKKEAEDILTSKLPKVDERKRQLFNQRADELQAKALFSTNVKDATEALRELVKVADAPMLAEEVRPRVLELSQRVIASANPNEVIGLKKALGDVYSDVTAKAMPDGANEARNALAYVESLERAPIFNDLVTRSMREVSPLASNYINEPSMYFEKYGE